MRATISFDIDVDKVEETMSALIAQQSNTLRIVATILDNVGSATLLEEITEAISLIGETSVQLAQYRDMLVSFERARWGSSVPATATPISSETPTEPQTPLGPEELLANLNTMKDAIGDMAKFDGFLEKMALPAIEEELPDDTEEG